MTTNHDVSKLDDLIVTTIDSVRGYEHSAKHVDAGHFQQFFEDMANERRRVIEALSAKSRELGGTPAEYGSTAATIHRRVEDFRRVLGGGDSAILSEIERGEDYLKEEFDRVLADERMSAGALGVVRECYASVLKGHDTTKKLRDLLQATA